MSFIATDQLPDEYMAMKFGILGYDAVDIENQLALFTTRGRTKYNPKWFVKHYVLPSGRTEGEIVKQFRAPDCEAAILYLHTLVTRGRL